jgi:hypothetical protein
MPVLKVPTPHSWKPAQRAFVKLVLVVVIVLPTAPLQLCVLLVLIRPPQMPPQLTLAKFVLLALIVLLAAPPPQTAQPAPILTPLQLPPRLPVRPVLLDSTVHLVVLCLSLALQVLILLRLEP